MKIALLLDPVIEAIDASCCGGTERAFLTHLDLFEKESIGFRAFSAAKVVNGRKYRIEKLFHLVWLAKIGEKLASFSIYFQPLWKIGNYIKALAALPYCLLFAWQCRDYDMFFVFNVPLLAIISPRKTVIRIGYPPEYLFFPLQRLFRHRYQQTFFYFIARNLKKDFSRVHKDLSIKNCFVIYNGVNTKIFSPHKPSKRLYKKRVLRFLYASNWNQRKGIFLLLKAAEILEERGLKFQLLISGGADLWSNIFMQDEIAINTASVYRITNNLNNVSIVGKTSRHKLPQLYRSVDYLVFPSIWKEPFGFVIIESMSCGTPVIAFKKGSTNEIIKDNKNGYLIDDISIKALAKSLQHLIEDETPNRIKQMGMSARKQVEEKFSLEIWSHNVKNLLIKRLGS